MLSLCEMRRVAALVNERFAGLGLERCVEPDRESIVLTLYGRDRVSGCSEKRFIGLSCRRNMARISQLEKLPPAPQNPPAFVSYLRAHLRGGQLAGARLLGDDRQLALRFRTREGDFDIVLSVFGTKSNVYVLNGEGRVVAALRPPADTRPELALGSAWQDPVGSGPGEGADRWPHVDDADYLAAIEADYQPREAQGESQSQLRELRQLLKKETKSAERRLARLEEELAEADQATELQRHGELLKSALGRIEAGADHIKLHDYESGEEVTIPLDPLKSPQQNLQATFKRYQKMLRRLTKAGGQLDAARDWCESVKGWGAELAELSGGDGEPSPEAVRAFAERPELASLLGKRRSRAQSSATKGPAPESNIPARFRKLPRKLHPRRYVSRDGLEIWVGRSDASNDTLTTRLAQGNDLFFHLDGAPGSHVILRTEGRSDPPSESLLDACELAVHFSKQKNAGRADVHVVPIKQVKKPKGAKPGLVYVTGGKSLHLRREESRLARVLESRID